ISRSAIGSISSRKPRLSGSGRMVTRRRSMLDPKASTTQVQGAGAELPSIKELDRFSAVQEEGADLPAKSGDRVPVARLSQGRVGGPGPAKADGHPPGIDLQGIGI